MVRPRPREITGAGPVARRPERQRVAEGAWASPPLGPGGPAASRDGSRSRTATADLEMLCVLASESGGELVGRQTTEVFIMHERKGQGEEKQGERTPDGAARRSAAC